MPERLAGLNLLVTTERIPQRMRTAIADHTQRLLRSQFDR
jgi:hypothetical protein